MQYTYKLAYNCSGLLVLVIGALSNVFFRCGRTCFAVWKKFRVKWFCFSSKVKRQVIILMFIEFAVMLSIVLALCSINALEVPKKSKRMHSAHWRCVCYRSVIFHRYLDVKRLGWTFWAAQKVPTSDELFFGSENVLRTSSMVVGSEQWESYYSPLFAGLIPRTLRTKTKSDDH